MKKLGVILAILVAISFVGCGSTGGGSGGGGAEPLIVDLSKVQMLEVINQDNSTVGPLMGNVLRNPEPLARQWQGIMWVFPDDFVDISQYTRVTVTAKFFNSEGVELPPRDSMAMIVFVYDIAGDWHGPAMGAGPNTPLKEFNLMGFSGMVHKDRGSRHGMNRAPKGLFIQRAQDANVAYIQLTSVVFHNGNYKSGAEVSGSGPEGSDE